MCTGDAQVGVTVEYPMVEIESNDDIRLWTQQAAAVWIKRFPSSPAQSMCAMNAMYVMASV